LAQGGVSAAGVSTAPRPYFQPSTSLAKRVCAGMQSNVALSGAMAGAVGSLLTHPLDTMRIRTQTSALQPAPLSLAGAAGARCAPPPGLGLVACGSSVMAPRRATLQSLFRGAVTPVSTATARSSVIFFGYDTALSLQGGGERLSAHAAAGFVAGAMACPITGPMELVKCRAQVTGGASASGSVLGHECRVWRDLCCREGVRGFTCGLKLTAARDALYRSVYFSTAEAVARALTPSKRSRGSAGGDSGASRPVYVSFIAGGTAGAVSWMPVYPLDVLKTHWQTGRRFGETTVWGMLRAGLAAEGPGWLSKGLSWTLLRAWSMNALVFASYEVLTRAGKT